MSITVNEKLEELCNSIPAKLRKISSEDLLFKPSPEKWSKKELIGHLIDSAATNHQRFVRAQFETPVIYYEQDNWVSLQHYQSEEIETIINLWEAYNRHLAHVINHIPTLKLSELSIGKDGKAYTLEFLIQDYLTHLEYHLNQILD